MLKRIRDQLSSLFAASQKQPGEAPTSRPPAPADAAEPKNAEAVPFAAPFEIVRVSGIEAPGTWHTLHKRSGIAPVLLGNRDSAKRVLEARQFNKQSFESIREAGLRLDVEEWIAERLREDPEIYTLDHTCTRPVSPISGFSSAIDILKRKPHSEVFIGLIPVEEPWLVPAYLGFGSWNDCPDASVHLGFFNRWFERYGAVVTTVADDVIEFNVTRPPTTEEASRQLALEQYVYCPDIVDQGVETLGNLAATLQVSSNWYFWWD